MDEPVDTGFAEVLTNPSAVWRAPDETVTAAVTPPAPVPVVLTPDGVQAAKALLHLPILTAPMLARLARELAMDIRASFDILKDYGLNKVQYDFLAKHNEFFKAALYASTIEWNSAMSTPERIKAQAAAALEDKLPDLAIRMGNKSEGLPGVVEAAKLFAKIAGVGERDVGAVASGERFTITINLGADEKLVVGTPKDISKPGSAAHGQGAVREDDQGKDRSQEVRAVTAGAGDSDTFRLVSQETGAAALVLEDTKK